MRKCTDEKYEKMLYAYELGILGEHDEASFEIHLLECPYCNGRALEFDKTAALLRENAELRNIVQDLESAGSDINKISGKNKISLYFKERLSSIFVPATVIAIIALVFLLLKPWNFEFQTDKKAIAASNSLIVLDFENLINADDPENLGAVAANLLITGLAESEYMEIVSRKRLNDILRQLGYDESKEIDLEFAYKIAEKAQSKWILKGSFLQITPRLTITIQMIDVENGLVKYSHRFESDNGESVFALMDKISSRVKSDLMVPIETSEKPLSGIADITTNSLEAYRYYLEGVHYYDKLYFEKALKAFTKALELDSTFAMVHYYMSSVDHPDHINNALKYSDAAGEKERLYIKYRYFLLNGDMPGAISILKNIIMEYPFEKEAYFLLGQISFNLGEFEKAKVHTKKAIEIDPFFKTAYNQLAYIYTGLQDYEKAIETIDLYIGIAPDEANPYDSKGEICAKCGKYGEAIQALNTAIRINPDFVNSKFLLAHIYIMTAKYNMAETIFDDLLLSEHVDTRTRSRFGKALIPLFQGKFSDALDVLNKGITDDLNENQLIMGYGDIGTKHFLKSRILGEQNKFDSALNAFKIYQMHNFQNYPDYALRGRHNLISLLARRGKLDSARFELDKLTGDFEEYFPHEMHWVSLASGHLNMAQENFDMAIVDLEKSLGGNIVYDDKYYLGLAYLRAGKYKDALEMFGLLQSIHSGSLFFDGIEYAKWLYYQGICYEELGLKDKAIKQYATFLNLWKDADSGIKEINDARERLKRLKNIS
jgi:tetratricopeptide (TPR) repeat protein